jgi:hypothetical protein
MTRASAARRLSASHHKLRMRVNTYAPRMHPNDGAWCRTSSGRAAQHMRRFCGSWRRPTTSPARSIRPPSIESLAEKMLALLARAPGVPGRRSYAALPGHRPCPRPAHHRLFRPPAARGAPEQRQWNRLTERSFTRRDGFIAGLVAFSE